MGFVFLIRSSEFRSFLALMASQKQHIVMLPFMAQGHLIPFLALAKLITGRHPSTTITLATTPLNIRNLSSLLPADSSIHLHPLPFSASDHGLPPGTENTDSLSYPTILNFYPSSESLRPHFDVLLSDLTRIHNRPPSAIIADVFTAWSVDTASAHNIFHATFTTCGGYGTATYFSLYLHRPYAGSDDPFSVPGFPSTFKLHRSQISTNLRNCSGTEPWFLFLQRQISASLRSSAMICNTVEEVEPEGLRLFRGLAGDNLPVYSVGPLLPLEKGATGRTPGVALTTCMEWLDAQLPASVVYVSFGSQNSISVAALAVLAAGLEGSSSPFIWVVRPPLGTDMNGELWLPEGFEERVGKRGLVIKGWAPQLEILSHPATGVFVSHCGWNSVLESLSRGVPIIAWPLASEQFYNAKMLEEEMGAGVELARGREQAAEGGEVERVIKMVLGKEGKGMREKAKWFEGRMRAAMSEEGLEIGSSLRAVDEFMDKVVSESARRSVVAED